MDLSYPTKEKLKSRQLIERLFAEGESVTKFPLKLVFAKADLAEDVKVQAGVSVAKRKVKLAVNRNRIKRLTREAYRLHKHLVFNKIETSYAFMFLYLGKEEPSQEFLNQKMILLLEKFLKHVDDEETT